jgi:hypothetical protein
MPTREFSLERIWIEDEAVDARQARLTVRRDDASPAEIGLFDWEVTALSDAKRWLVQGEYSLRLESEDGREFSGQAILTSTDGANYHFRGLGNLKGFEQAEFSE